MTTVREIIQDAMLEIGALGVADAMPAEDAAFALRTLNRMVSKWNNETLMIYTVNRQVFPLVAGQQVYTLGTSGDFNIPRPNKINQASVILNNATYPIEVPIQMLTDEEWQDYAVKATPSTFPTAMWVTGDVPLNRIYFWPVPQDSTVQVALYVWGRTTAFATVNDTVIFPDGYEEALVTNLAVALCSAYGKDPAPTLGMRAAAAKSALQGLNADPLYTEAGWGAGSGSKAIRSFGYQID